MGLRFAVLPRQPAAGNRKQKGAALLLALMVMALAALLATRLLTAQDEFLGQVQAERDIRQARLLAQAGVDWGRAVLLEDMLSNSVDHLGEAWANEVPAIETEGGRIGGHLRDAQARFNINSLLGPGNTIDRPMLAVYTRLLSSVGADSALGPRLAEWMQQTGLEAAERDHHGTSSTGRNGYALADLARVPGYTPELVQRLQPYLAALPVRTPINVNTADAVVIAAAADLSIEQAAETIAERQRAWFRDLGDFSDRAKPRGPVGGLVSVQSQFFEAQVAVQYGQAELMATALLRRQPALERVDISAIRFGRD